jgi:hypothetical protein
VIPTASILALILNSSQPPVGQDQPDAPSSGSSGASGNSAPDEVEDEGEEEMSEAEAAALFGGTPPDDAPPDDAPPDGPTEGPAEPPTGPTEHETIVSGTEVAPAEDLDLTDIFGDETAIEELPDATSIAKDGPKTGSGLFDGKLDVRVRVVSSVYIDIDNVYDGRRWNPNQPSLGESVEMPSAFKIGQAVPRGTVSRNENRLEFFFRYRPNEHIEVVGDIEPVFLGVSQISSLNDAATMRMMTPFHIESDAAYVAIIDALPGLDIKIGRQIVVWGTADKFSPTNNINPDDLEDRPLFTEPIANQMLVVDFAPLQDKLWFQGVYVPLFFPALLPPSAAFALGDPQTPVNFANQSDVAKLAFLQNFITANDQFNPRVYASVAQPPVNITNGQAAFKIGSRLGPVDMSASYYYGFFDIPIPYKSQSTQLAPLMDPSVDGYWFKSDVTLVYPRMHVVGLDFATQLPFLDDLGLWGEGALIIPTQGYDFYVDLPLNMDITPNDGVMNPVDHFSGAIVKKQPFIKATVGADYTIGKHVYLNAQYLRGFIDDFGASNIGNYLVGGTDLVFFGRHLIFRFFTVTDFPKNKADKASVVLAPNIIMVPPWGYATLELGGFAFLGRNDTKFGQTAVGSSIAYLKVTGSF